MMAQCKNGTKNEGCYGRHERFPILMTRRLEFGHSMAEIGIPTSERSVLAPLVLLVQEGCGFQKALLEDCGPHFPLVLQWWWVPRRMNNHHPSSDEWFER